jgi:hypothetical protein
MNFEDELYRSYSRDGYATYANHQNLIAHNKDINVGIFWPNPSDTWLRIKSKSTERGVRFLSECGFLNVSEEWIWVWERGFDSGNLG